MRHAALRAEAGGQARVRADASASGLVAFHRRAILFSCILIAAGFALRFIHVQRMERQLALFAIGVA